MLKLCSFIKNDSGQAMVEFALTFWIYILITFFIIDFGWVAFQRASFEYGYMRSSWSVSASDLNDEDKLEEVPSKEEYTDEVADLLFSKLTNCSPGIIEGNVAISGANAILHNEKVKYDVPDNYGNPVEASSITRYMKLNADISYVIHPLTPIGSMVFGDDITVDRTLDCTRIVRTQQRSR